MTPGIHKLSMAEYLALQAFSSGLAHTILSASPLHAWTESWLNPNREAEDSSVMDIGTYAHALLLEGSADALVICPFDDWRKNDAKAMRDEARAAGKLPILQHKVPEVEAMVAAARDYIATSEIKGIFDTGAAEQTLVWEADGVLCKARPDWLSADRRICLSYKTTAGSANPDVWIRTQLPGYDAAAVFYERGVLACCPEAEETLVVHLVQEQSAPFGCSLIALSPAYDDLACRKLNRALDTWAACVKSGKWPAYPTRIAYAEPMPWDAQRFEEAEANSAQFTEEELKGGIPL